MIRVLFSILAVVVAVLALVLDQPLLYLAAAVLLLMALGLLIAVLRRRYRNVVTPYTPARYPSSPESALPRRSPEDELKALGILDIRPKEPSPQQESDDDRVPVAPIQPESTDPVPPVPATSPPVEQSSNGSVSFSVPSVVRDQAREGETEATQPTPVSPPANGAEEPTTDSHDLAVLVPCLQALRAAVEARTVCLLKQEDFAPDYHVVALVGEENKARPGNTFSTTVPLLTASQAQQPVTVRHVGEGGIPEDSLGYRTEAGSVRQVALAPVPRRADPEAYVLLADTDEDDHLSRPRVRAVLAQFARLLGTLLAPADVEWVEQLVRPRREIIAEEMERARDQDQLLALALVYLNQAEAIADGGEAAVAAAERALETRLRHITKQGRIERFGELTFGVFYKGDVHDIEAWGTQVQRELATATGTLTGGVSIGIAVLQGRHQTPEELRADATTALREAYTTGTCTILE
ncbi:MAG: hypothetical protein ACE5G0_08395 [Rhodothermales bacterium]